MTDETRVLTAVWDAFRRWLPQVRAAVLAPWEKARATPDPQAVASRTGLWVSQVDGPILDAVRLASHDGWRQVAPDEPFVSTASHIVASLATTRNLLVRIPDEVAALVFAAMAENQQDPQMVVDAIDRVLSTTGSERWPGRAQTIARTETTRAVAAGMQAAAEVRQARTGSPLRKQWDARDDTTTRPEHREVDGTTVPLGGVFWVGGVPMRRPGDELAPPDLVVGCRCRLRIVEVQ